jgi:hypothetical protein
MILPPTAYSALTLCEKIIHIITCGKKKFHKIDRLTTWEEAHMVHVRASSILNQPTDERK